MGLFSWLFPTDEDRIKKARKLLAADEPAAARLEVMGIDSPDARSITEEAETTLVRRNLARAETEIAGGLFDEAASHLELATEFSHGRNATELREARRRLREGRAAAAADRPRTSPLAGLDPFGGGPTMEPGPGGPEVPVEAPSPGFKGDPIFSLPPDDPRVRYAMVLEGYPERVRERALALGADYAQVVLRLEDGDARTAVQELDPFVRRDAVALFERARAWLELGNVPAATADLQAFVAEFGHQRMGPLHTAVLLSRTLTTQGRLPDALALIREVRTREPKDLELMAHEVAVLEASGRLPEADELGRRLLTRLPNDMGVIKMLARIRLAGGKRLEAMQVLESGVHASTCSTGKCGSKPLDVDAVRLLARLYLEDRLDPKRAGELLELLATSGAAEDWIDGYLVALQARNAGDPQVERIAADLVAGLGPQDPRRRLVDEHFRQAS